MPAPGLSATGSAAPAIPRPQWWRLLAVGLQFALLVVVMHRFELESGAVLRLSVLALARLRRPRRAATRLATGVFCPACRWPESILVLGPVSGAWLVGLGLASDGHLPPAGGMDGEDRTAAGLWQVSCWRYLRSGRLESPFSGAIWPILGSMFMFRLIAYVYDLRHEKVKPRLLAHGLLLLPPAQRLLSTVSGRRLQDLSPHLLRRGLRRRRNGDLPERRALGPAWCGPSAALPARSTTI